MTINPITLRTTLSVGQGPTGPSGDGSGTIGTITPSGSTGTVDLSTHRYWSVNATSGSGMLTATITPPENPSEGIIAVVTHATTVRDITWQSSAAISWVGTEPDWAAEGVNSTIYIEWYYNGTTLALSAVKYAELTNPGQYIQAERIGLRDFEDASVRVIRLNDGQLEVEGVPLSFVGHTHTKSQVGLANVDNTSDVNKPVSTATSQAIFDLGVALSTSINGKQATLVSGTNIKTINGSSILGSGNLTISGGGGSGDVVGPASSLDNEIPRFNLTTGKLIQTSGATISDAGDLAITSITMNSCPLTSDGGNLEIFGTPVYMSTGGTLTGYIDFSGTDHEGIRLNNLTTTQINLLTPLAGMLPYDSTLNVAKLYDGTAWRELLDTSGGQTILATTTITPAANTSALVASGYSLTGSNATSMVSLTGTWNTSGAPVGFNFQVTDTNSSSQSRIARFGTAAGSSEFGMTKNGVFYCGNGTGFVGIQASSNIVTIGRANSADPSTLDGGSAVASWATNGDEFCVNVALGIGRTYASRDVLLYRDAAATLALRNSTNAQTYRIYNTYTSGSGTNASNNIVGEWLATEWASNVAWITTRKGTSGGTARDLVLGTDGTERMRVNSTGTLFEGIVYGPTGVYGTLVNGFRCGAQSRTGGAVGWTLACGNDFGTTPSLYVARTDGTGYFGADANGLHVNGFVSLCAGGVVTTTKTTVISAASNGVVQIGTTAANALGSLLLTNLTASGYITPGTLTDAAAPNNSIYYSSTASKLVYKDSGGTVNNLY
jgi:hypothetical protein